MNEKIHHLSLSESEYFLIQQALVSHSLDLDPELGAEQLVQTEALSERLSRFLLSEEPEMVVSFVGEAYEAYRETVDRMKGWGVTVTAVSGEQVEAVLVGADHDADDGATVRFVPNGERFDYDLSQVPAEEIISTPVRRIEVS